MFFISDYLIICIFIDYCMFVEFMTSCFYPALLIWIWFMIIIYSYLLIRFIFGVACFINFRLLRYVLRIAFLWTCNCISVLQLHRVNIAVQIHFASFINLLIAVQIRFDSLLIKFLWSYSVSYKIAALCGTCCSPTYGQLQIREAVLQADWCPWRRRSWSWW